MTPEAVLACSLHCEIGKKRKPVCRNTWSRALSRGAPALGRSVLITGCYSFAGKDYCLDEAHLNNKIGRSITAVPDKYL